MELTYLGHACVQVEMGRRRILTDPWLTGPAHCSSWWHLPPAIPPERLTPSQFILISHIHEDHFHPPTLERLPKSAAVLIPLSPDPWMGRALKQMGFHRVIEMPHGKPISLGEGLTVTNFQCGRIDSAFWVEHPEGSLLNLNDCPVTDRQLSEWVRRFPAPDVVLSAFSYASPYPVCYEVAGLDREVQIRESVQRVLEQFARTMAKLKPRYAVPFATQYGFLIPDQLWMNDRIPTPLEAIEILKRQGGPTQGVLLNPGDRLSLKEGLQRIGPSFEWSRKKELLSRIASDRSAEVRQRLESEPAAPADLFERFRLYFNRVLRNNPSLRKRIGIPIAFILEPKADRWVVDCAASSGERVRSNGLEASVEIRLPSSLLARAVSGQLHWETLYLSNRLRVRLPEEMLGKEWDFWRMLFNFPEGVLKDRLRLLTPRGIRILWRRRAEMAGLILERLRRPSNREPYRE